MTTAKTVDEIFQTLPSRLKTADIGNATGTFHFKISGATGGDYSVSVANGQCAVEKGLTGTPNCTVNMSDETYISIETGKSAPEMAFMTGKIKVDNIPEMLKFLKFFNKLST